MQQQYGIDKIEFTSPELAFHLQKQRKFTVPKSLGRLQILDTQATNNSINIKNLPPGHVSLIRLTGDIQKLIEFLLQQNSFLSMPLVPYLVELYRNTPFESDQKAVEFTRHAQAHTALKHVRSNPFLYSNTRISSMRQTSAKKFSTESQYIHFMSYGLRDPKPDVLDNRTLYLGEAPMIMVIYARNDKFSGVPCCREEFRISGYRLAKNLGLLPDEKNLKANLEQLSNRENLKNNFVTLYESNVLHCKINDVKLFSILKKRFEAENQANPENRYNELPIKMLKRAERLYSSASYLDYIGRLGLRKDRYYEKINVLSS